MVQRIYTASDLASIFEKTGYGENFSYDGYQALLDYYDSDNDDMECDVVSICCEWSELSEDELSTEYSYLLSFSDYLSGQGFLETEDESLDEDELLEMEKYADYWSEYIDALVDELESRTMVIHLTDSYLVQSW